MQLLVAKDSETSSEQLAVSSFIPGSSVALSNLPLVQTEQVECYKFRSSSVLHQQNWVSPYKLSRVFNPFQLIICFLASQMVINV